MREGTLLAAIDTDSVGVSVRLAQLPDRTVGDGLLEAVERDVRHVISRLVGEITY